MALYHGTEGHVYLDGQIMEPIDTVQLGGVFLPQPAPAAQTFAAHLTVAYTDAASSLFEQWNQPTLCEMTFMGRTRQLGHGPRRTRKHGGQWPKLSQAAYTMRTRREPVRVKRTFRGYFDGVSVKGAQEYEFSFRLA